MITDALLGIVFGLLDRAVALVPVVDLPDFDISPLLGIFAGVTAILPASALVYCITVALTLSAAQLALAVWRFIRTVGAP